MTRYHVAAIDPSLTATGVARIRPHDERPITLSLVTSSAIPNADYPDTLGRIRMIAGNIIRAANRGVEDGDVVVYVMEGPIFGQSTGMYHTRAGLWWLLYHLLSKAGPVVVIEPTKLKLYVTGKGNAKKDVVFSKIVSIHPHRGIVDNNEADALGLAAMVARELGFPIEPSVQKCHPAALDGVKWPELVTAARAAHDAQIRPGFPGA